MGGCSRYRITRRSKINRSFDNLRRAVTSMACSKVSPTAVYCSGATATLTCFSEILGKTIVMGSLLGYLESRI